MNRPRRSVLYLSLALASWVAPAACWADDPDVKLETDVVYTRAGGTELKLDLARPARGEGPFPAVLVIHGGGWRGGDKSNSHGPMLEFARRGYVAVSPQYRFCPKDPFPAQVHDVKAAVRWVKSHAGTYHVDRDRVGAVGFSAGGHLALMLGLTGPADGLEGDAPAGATDTRIAAAVNFFGPSDLTAADIPEGSKPLVRDFLGGTVAEKHDAAVKASPVTYVSKDDAPVLTFQGTKDPIVPYTQATRLAEAQTAAGVPGRVELLVGASHGWADGEWKRTMRETFDFFDAHIGPRRAPTAAGP